MSKTVRVPDAIAELKSGQHEPGTLVIDALGRSVFFGAIYRRSWPAQPPLTALTPTKGSA